ncbi:MAG: MCE family protein, partial [Mycobacteriaceae bacterium]|nr:MCE family protein [Mycobacteriaceae bacterium]
MQKYRGSKLVRSGFIGLALILLVITVGLQPQRLVELATSIRHQALFTDAGGLSPGNDVRVSGVKVGTVSEVALKQGKALVTFMVDGRVRLGADTTAHIRTGTLLGQRLLTLESSGKGTLRSSDVIPVTR